MTDMTDLQSLIERVEKATGPDREIDALIAESFGATDAWSWYARANTTNKMAGKKHQPIEVWIYFTSEAGGWFQWGEKSYRRAIESEESARKVAEGAPGPWYHKPEPHEIEIVREAAAGVPHYTTDLNAALSLVSRALPGWFWSVSNAATMPRANVWEPLPTRPVMGPFSSAPTPALAIILALLRAKAAEQEKTQEQDADGE